MFINRTKQLEALEDEYSSSRASFSVVYGRRRVGKTALLSEFIRGKKHIYPYITQSDLNSQLESFTKQILTFVDETLAKHLSFTSFEEAIGFLTTLRLDEKLILIIPTINCTLVNCANDHKIYFGIICCKQRGCNILLAL